MYTLRPNSCVVLCTVFFFPVGGSDARKLCRTPDIMIAWPGQHRQRAVCAKIATVIVVIQSKNRLRKKKTLEPAPHGRRLCRRKLKMKVSRNDSVSSQGPIAWAIFGQFVTAAGHRVGWGMCYRARTRELKSEKKNEARTCSQAGL